MRITPLVRWIAPVLAVLLPLARPAAAEEVERWYIVEMMGQPAGWARTSQATEEGLIVTRSDFHLRIARAATSVSLTMEGVFAETEDGRPVWMKSVQAMAGSPTTIEYRWGEGELLVTSTVGEERIEDTRPLPAGDWLTPVRAAARVKEQLAAGADPIVIRTIDPTAGPEPMTVTRADLEPTMLDVGGRQVRVVKCTSTSSVTPGLSSVEYLDAEGVAVRTELRMMGMAIVVTEADQAAALAAGRGEVEVPELMVSTFVRPDRPIEQARRTRRASYVLRLNGGRLPHLPRTGAQRVEVLSETSARIVLTPADLRPAAEAEVGDRSYLDASIMINGDDPQVRRLAERATREAGDDPAARAEAMRRFVYRHIGKKSLGVGFASASEVARRREGDCSEHATLLAAMLRADGIPSRVASGLLYVDQFEGQRGIFGYHMWAQALVEVAGRPTWIDLDATLPEDVPFDATHIALATSALRDGELQDAFVAMAGLIGQLSIEVEQAE